jgi:superfamily II DNA or RNA helicase
MLGLSATPTRKDQLTRVIHWYLGKTAFSTRYKNREDVLVKIVRYNHPKFLEPSPVNKRGDICYVSMVTNLVELRERTDAIASEAASLAESGFRVLVLSHRRNHAKAIAERLRELGEDSDTYLGGDKFAPECVITCATYSLVSEGFDDPRLTAIVLATPASDVVQACGRILRGGGEDGDRVIVDIADSYGLCYAQLAKRKSWYRSVGFTIADSVPGDMPKEDPKESVF